VTGLLHDPDLATRLALRRLARRHLQLTAEITAADADLKQLVTAAAPALLNLVGVGVEVAGQLLTTAGDNPDRMRSEAAFAHLCGAAPIPARSGKTRRHRLNRAGDRGADNALYTIVLSRLRCDPAPAATSTDAQQKASGNPKSSDASSATFARELDQVLVTARASSSSRPPEQPRRAGQP
jgi:transposase